MPPRKTSFDQLDYQILKALHQDARTPAADIARLTGANERTIRKRIERLVSDGVVRLTAILEPAAFGYRTAADIFLEVEPALEEQTIQALMDMPEVTYVAFGQDTNQVSIEARFKDNDALRTFVRHTLTALPGVKITGYTYVPRILRNIDEWMPPSEEFNPPGQDV
jgi:DNA-binding Lrp family transcriptional regulator